jgi:hypothetical protein
LRAAPPRVVLTHADTLDDRELLVSVDGLLAEHPAAAVLTDRAVLHDLGDPRVHPTTPDALRAAAVRVHLHRGTRSDGEAWRTLLGHDRLPPDTETDLLADGTPLVTLTDLRRHRRAGLGLEPATRSEQDAPAGLRPVGGTSLAAWLGGWG